MTTILSYIKPCPKQDGTFRGLQMTFKGNAQFFQKVTFECLMDFKQNH